MSEAIVFVAGVLVGIFFYSGFVSFADEFSTWHDKPKWKRKNDEKQAIDDWHDPDWYPNGQTREEWEAGCRAINGAGFSIEDVKRAMNSVEAQEVNE